MTGDRGTDNWRELEEVRRGLLREVNERISVLSWRFTGQDATSRAQFICECGDPKCTDPVEVELEVYERVRAEPRRYLIAANHEDPETETVVVSTGHHAIVEKLAGDNSKIAETTDPRRTTRFAELQGEREHALREARGEGAA